MRGWIIGGTYDPDGGRPSKIVNQLNETLDWTCVNGGSLEMLHKILDEHLTEMDVLLWMPNISNEEEKILPTIKKRNPKLFLIQSKRADGRDFTVSDMIGRMLGSHSNLGIYISRLDITDWKGRPTYNFTLLDPLGNEWCNDCRVSKLAETIDSRVSEVMQMSRVGSTRLGDRRSFSIDPRFIDIIRSYGDRFATFVNEVNPNRLLGNASTRCAKGFPGIRMVSTDGSMYVTRRNVDKQTLSLEDFVEVTNAPDGRVGYYGDNKPSVDTPVQMRLFNYYRNVNYMLHGHVYVEGGQMTAGKTPCGYLDEFDQIKMLYPDPDAMNFVVNLRGHGCLIMAGDLDFFANQTLMGRPFPER